MYRKVGVFCIYWVLVFNCGYLVFGKLGGRQQNLVGSGQDSASETATNDVSLTAEVIVPSIKTYRQEELQKSNSSPETTAPTASIASITTTTEPLTTKQKITPTPKPTTTTIKQNLTTPANTKTNKSTTTTATTTTTTPKPTTTKTTATSTTTTTPKPSSSTSLVTTKKSTPASSTSTPNTSSTNGITKPPGQHSSTVNKTSTAPRTTSLHSSTTPDKTTPASRTTSPSSTPASSPSSSSGQSSTPASSPSSSSGQSSTPASSPSSSSGQSSTPASSPSSTPEHSSSSAYSSETPGLSSTSMSAVTRPTTKAANLTTTTASSLDKGPTPATVFGLFLSVISVVVIAGLLGLYIWRKTKDSYVPCTWRACRGWCAKRARSASAGSQGPLTSMDDTTSIDITDHQARPERELFSIGDQDGGSEVRSKTRSRRGTEDDYFYDEIFERSAFVDERINKSNKHLTIDSEDDDDDELDIPDLIFKKPTAKY